MPYIKKSVVIFLVSAILGGGAWYFNTTGIIGGISSSVLDTTTFSCTEQALKSQASLYRTTVTRHKKAIVIKKKLEAEIELLKKSDPNNQLQRKQETLKLLARQINTYLRFIKKYETCKKEIKLNPAVSSGIMSGEAKIEISQKEYHELAAFEISSPTGLNTYLDSIQFKAGILPDLGIMADTWFLLYEGANPIACQISSDGELIDCELSGDMPFDIMSGMSRTYGIGAHITGVYGSGSVDIQISKIFFNNGRSYSDTLIQSPLLSFGVVPVVEEAPIPIRITPSIVSEERPEVIIPDVVAPVENIPTQTESTIPPSSETTSIPETSEEVDPITQTETETPPADVSVEQEVQTNTTEEAGGQTETDPPASSETSPSSDIPPETTPTPTSSDATTPPPVAPEASNPVVPTSSESTPPASSETPPASDATGTV